MCLVASAFRCPCLGWRRRRRRWSSGRDLVAPTKREKKEKNTRGGRLEMDAAGGRAGGGSSTSTSPAHWWWVPASKAPVSAPQSPHNRRALHQKEQNFFFFFSSFSPASFSSAGPTGRSGAPPFPPPPPCCVYGRVCVCLCIHRPGTQSVKTHCCDNISSPKSTRREKRSAVPTHHPTHTHTQHKNLFFFSFFFSWTDPSDPLGPLVFPTSTYSQWPTSPIRSAPLSQRHLRLLFSSEWFGDCCQFHHRYLIGRCREIASPLRPSCRITHKTKRKKEIDFSTHFANSSFLFRFSIRV